jgi:predicted dehydrogenase
MALAKRKDRKPVLRCGIVGFGFIGPHHADAIRRLGFVEVAAICTRGAADAERKAAEYHIPKAYWSYKALLEDPAIDVVDIATPTRVHCEMALAAIAGRKHVIVDKPLAINALQAKEMLSAARSAAVTHAVTFNYRYNVLVQQARSMISQGALGEVRMVHGHYLQEWLLWPTDFNWRLDPAEAGPAAMIADAGSHWFDLVQYVTGLRIQRLFASLRTQTKIRRRPPSPTRGGEDQTGQAFDYSVQVPDYGTILVEFENGACGEFVTSASCAGHKNDLRFEVNGTEASLAWEQERPNELWVGRRNEPDQVIRKSPELLDSSIRHYAALPGGHNEAWPDAFRNLMRNIFSAIATGEPGDFPTFVDGYRAALIAEAALESDRSGGNWVDLPLVHQV